MSSGRSVMLKRGEGDAHWVVGDHVTVKVGATETAGQFAMCELYPWPEAGPPPHVHRLDDEWFYVVEGDFTFMLEETIVRGGPGLAVYLPKGRVHQYRNVGTQPGRLLVFTTPSGFDAFIRESGVAAPPFPTAMAPVTPELVERVMAVLPKYGIEFQPEARATKHITLPIDRHRWVLGELVNIKLTGNETNGNFTVAEITSPPGGGPPPHLHRKMGELFYVLEGEYEFGVADRVERVTVGATIYAPPGVAHYYENVGTSRARLIDVHTPGFFEAFFEEMGLPATDLQTPPQETIDPQRVVTMIEKHGMELVNV